jgi:hypothetical protein
MILDNTNCGLSSEICMDMKILQERQMSVTSQSSRQNREKISLKQNTSKLSIKKSELEQGLSAMKHVGMYLRNSASAELAFSVNNKLLQSISNLNTIVKEFCKVGQMHSFFTCAIIFREENIFT